MAYTPNRYGPDGDLPPGNQQGGTAMNTKWAINELKLFVDLCHQHGRSYKREISSRDDLILSFEEPETKRQERLAQLAAATIAAGDMVLGDPRLEDLHDEIIGRIPIVEQIADQIWPQWRVRLPKSTGEGFDYEPLLNTANQVLVRLDRKKELEENLGEQGPALSAPAMHIDVWEASKSLWRNGHFGEAVTAAARSVNAALQAKVNRRDISETRLIAECFSLDPPKPNAPRLRLMPDDGSDTYKSLQTGAIAFGQGCFKAIRNVLVHEYGTLAEPPEEEALHYLAAFSILARWIDQAAVER
jgi:hypothetical protein